MIDEPKSVEENEARDWNALFETFIIEKRFLQGVSDRTIGNYRDAWKAFKRYGKTGVSAQGVKNFMIEMIKSDVKPGAANFFARSMNSLFTWAYENGHTETHLKVPLQKLAKKVMQTYKPEEVNRILTYKPVEFGEKRLMALLALLIDTGARIDEALTLVRSKIDFNQCLATFFGKGKKERVVPFSPECGAILREWLKEHKHDLVFCSENGTKVDYNNLKRDFNKLLEKIGVNKSEGVFHAFRRFFAREYTRNGGSPFYLQKMLGHASLEMTRRYTELDTDDLREKHRTASPLKNLAGKSQKKRGRKPK